MICTSLVLLLKILQYKRATLNKAPLKYGKRGSKCTTFFRINLQSLLGNPSLVDCVAIKDISQPYFPAFQADRTIKPVAGASITVELL